MYFVIALLIDKRCNGIIIAHAHPKLKPVRLENSTKRGRGRQTHL